MPLIDAARLLLRERAEAALYAARRGAAALAFWRRAHRSIVKLGARGSRWLSTRSDIAVPAPRVTVRRHHRCRRCVQRRLPGRLARRQPPRSACGRQPARRALDARGGRHRRLRRPACPGRSDDGHRMKLAIIGGAGVRTPLLVRGLTPLGSGDQHDRAVRPGPRAPGDHRAAGRAHVRRRRVDAVRDGGRVPRGRRLRVHQHPRRRHRAAACHDEADRAPPRDRRSGDRRPGRVRDGDADHPANRRLRAGDRRRMRRDAWIINFTNPVGMVTEAMRTASERDHRHLRHADRAVRRNRPRAGAATRRTVTSTTSG